MLVSNFYHTTYCTNIHPGEDWKTTFDSLKNYVPLVKSQVSKTQEFGLGLRLSNKASEELGFGSKLQEFKDWLTAHQIYIFTMNGFPYGNFHGEAVKDKVHRPDWTTQERVDYTIRLFKQLNFLLPEGISGGISTSPISYKHWYSSEEELDHAKKVGAQGMIAVALRLYQTEKETGNYLHLDIEPEPDGILENSDEVISFFKEYLIPIGVDRFKKEFGIPNDNAERIIKRHLTICYDICHFSLAYEEPEHTFQKFLGNDIKIGKIQVSAALKVLFNETDNQPIWESLSKFNEPTYLHQVTELSDEGVKTHADLPELLEKKGRRAQLRAHFHVPIFLQKFPPLYSTQDHILKVIDYLKKNKICDHLEIETYTWDVLPIDLKTALSDSIIREINWLKERL